MRVLFDIVHPAHALFFRDPIETLRQRGDEVLVASRHKDVTCDLLDELGIAHRPASRAGKGVAGLANELILRDLAILRLARRFRPDVMAGFGGVAIAHAGKLLGIPAISFYDTEAARLQTRVTWPFITHLYVPEAYAGPTPAGRTTRLRGIKQLAYLHPARFRADREIAIAHGLDPDRDNFFIRLVAWEANHDIGRSGWSPEALRQVVADLGARGKVHISSEATLPADLEDLRYRGPVAALHHLLGHCRLYVGESATMASEAALLGVPTIYASRDFRGFIGDLERAGLARQVREDTPAALCGAAAAMLDEDPAAVAAARDAYVAACPDWAETVVTALERHADGGR